MPPTLPAETTLGAVYLTVSDLERSLAYYRDSFGFKVHRREGDTAYLDAGGDDLLVLTENPAARRARGTTGLYHFAILVPSRLELAKVLRNFSVTRTPVGGFADHLVSEAIYLSDPDGNGIEIYRDRPRAEWKYNNGAIAMATDPIDLDGIMAELDGRDQAWTGLHPQTIIGHMHLHVAHLQDTQAFYCGVLGFDLIMNYGGSALFVSAGGYHHHIGLNTWAGVGAPPPPPDAVGLRYFVIRLPDAESLQQVVERLHAAGIATEQRDDGVFVRDPSQNGILLAAG